MSNLRVNTIKNEDGTQGPIFEGNVEFSGISHMVLPKGTTGERPSGAKIGSLRFNTTTKLIEQYNGSSWVSFSSESSTSNRAVFNGSYNGYPLSYEVSHANLYWFYIQSSGPIAEEVYFGKLTFARAYNGGGFSSTTRGVFAGGHNPEQGPSYVAGSSYYSNIIDYVTISTTGDAKDFGDLLTGRYGASACSSSTRGIVAGGAYFTTSPNAPTGINSIEYVTIASASNATTFGELLTSRYYSGSGSCGSSTRGIFSGGNLIGTGKLNSIEYVTIASASNGTTFGTLSYTRDAHASSSSDTRGVFISGRTDQFSPYRTNLIDYVTIASTGDAQYFGTLTQSAKEGSSASSSKIRAVVFGCYASDNYNSRFSAPISDYLYYRDVIMRRVEYITIANLGDAVDFGSLTKSYGYSMSCSNNHGGL